MPAAGVAIASPLILNEFPGKAQLIGILLICFGAYF
jgi:drug/metabolite transporter (DMT)-like permease